MKSAMRCVFALALFFAVSCTKVTNVAATEKTEERPAGVAGAFYPADPAQLSAFIDHALAEAAVQSSDKPLVAIVAPHAGYQFSGSVAAYSYALLKGRPFKRVVIIAPSHYEYFEYSSVYDGDAYITPLGRVPVDRDFARRLAASGDRIRLSQSGHRITGSTAEHAVEVQLPFLQKVLGDFSIVPVVMGDQSYEASRALGLALAKLLKNDPSTLIVASSDLSHYHGYDEAVRMDHKLLQAIEDDDFLTVSNNTGRRVWEACGAAPIVATMIAAQRLGSSHPKLLKYANSGDTFGDKSRVVGYSAIAFFRQQEAADDRPFSLSESEKSELLRIALASVDAAVREGKAYDPPAPVMPSLLQERGVFVTLKKHGELRGCIGYTAPVLPLYQAVAEVARLAALRDPRFPPVSQSELKELQYEISVLSSFHHLIDANQVRVGVDGLLIRRRDSQGILLPQVPAEEGWDRAAFLEGISQKAGLERTAWRDPDSDLFTFTALVFSDKRAPSRD
jgi:hypothetical protein